MLGCGETVDEVRQAMNDLREHNVDILTLGQYLQPSKNQMKVHEYVHPTIFNDLQKVRLEVAYSFRSPIAFFLLGWGGGEEGSPPKYFNGFLDRRRRKIICVYWKIH